MGNLFAIIITITFVNNVVLSQFLGLCPFVNSSDKTDKSFGMGMAVTFVMTMASFVTYLLYTFLLKPDAKLLKVLFPDTEIARNGLQDVLQTATFILVIAALVQLVEIFMRKSLPGLYRSLGIFLPLITTNCAVLGVALLNTSYASRPLSLVEAVVQGFFAGIGFTVAMLLMSGVRERLDKLDVPEPLRGTPITFIATGLMALAFLGFAGMGT
ncbi:MAG: electron transport complex subunit RsxA [Planctomycetes bacterium]|nr:electron transport complex subunit RsxA [Planctomycetota bacterium]